jgi:hypothetical protein
MRSLSAVEMKDASPDSVNGSVSAPQIIFYYSDQTVASGGKDQPTPQAKISRDVDESLFGGKSPRVGVIARRFDRFKVNVSSLTAKSDPVFNAQSAPVVVVKASDGSKVATLPGKVTEDTLLAAMLKALQKDKVDASRLIAQGVEALNQIRKLVDERDRLKVNLAQLTAKMADAGGKTEALKARETQARAELVQVEKNLAAAYEKLKKAKES